MQTQLGEIGIAEERNFPKNYWKQFLYPFSKKIQKGSKTISVFLVLLLGSFSLAAQTMADDVTGKWLLADGSTQIEVNKEGDKYVGKITWVKDAVNKKDIGKKVLWDLEYDASDNEWNSGEIQMPDMSHSASCYIRLKDKNTAIVTGYHGLRMFGKSKKLIRQA